MDQGESAHLRASRTASTLCRTTLALLGASPGDPRDGYIKISLLILHFKLGKLYDCFRILVYMSCLYQIHKTLLTLIDKKQVKNNFENGLELARLRGTLRRGVGLVDT